MAPRRKSPRVGRHDIGALPKEVGAILDIKRDAVFPILRVIKQAMTEALRRREPIKIMGFGIFRVIDVPARRRPCSKNPPIVPFKAINLGERTVIEYPAHAKVVFQPSRRLLRMLNGNDHQV